MHKDRIFCAVNNGKKSEEVKEYSTVTSSIRSMAEYLKGLSVSRIHGRIRNRHAEVIRDALEGHIGQHHRFGMNLLVDEFSLLQKQSEKCLEMMKTLCMEHYPKEMELLKHTRV